jgi:hypothetical protein
MLWIPAFAGTTSFEQAAPETLRRYAHANIRQTLSAESPTAPVELLGDGEER